MRCAGDALGEGPVACDLCDGIMFSGAFRRSRPLSSILVVGVQAGDRVVIREQSDVC